MGNIPRNANHVLLGSKSNRNDWPSELANLTGLRGDVPFPDAKLAIVAMSDGTQVKLAHLYFKSVNDGSKKVQIICI